MMFAYLNLCKRDASVIKAIAENSIVQYVLVHVSQYVYFFNDGTINTQYHLLLYPFYHRKMRYCDALNDISTTTIAQELFYFIIASRIEQKVRAMSSFFYVKCRCVTIKRQHINIYHTFN